MCTECTEHHVHRVHRASCAPSAPSIMCTECTEHHVHRVHRASCAPSAPSIMCIEYTKALCTPRHHSTVSCLVILFKGKIQQVHRAPSGVPTEHHVHRVHRASCAPSTPRRYARRGTTAPCRVLLSFSRVRSTSGRIGYMTSHIRELAIGREIRREGFPHYINRDTIRTRDARRLPKDRETGKEAAEEEAAKEGMNGEVTTATTGELEYKLEQEWSKELRGAKVGGKWGLIPGPGWNGEFA
ncbi:UNVERIFIED_CONTAM: hypothetical protein FKN15_056839 [Acipenser sinensis]